MAENEANPYRAPREQGLSSPTKPKRFKLLPNLIFALISYYSVSSLTLPFADEWWIGELPVLAIIQLPKVHAHDWVQAGLMTLIRRLGLSKGSPSPDMIATQPWAFGILFTVPSLALIGLVACCGKLKACRTWIAYLTITATIDGTVTLWFEATSNLSLF